MRFYASQNNPLKFAEHLTDYREGEYRFRVGDYRLAFDVNNGQINIKSGDEIKCTKFAFSPKNYKLPTIN